MQKFNSEILEKEIFQHAILNRDSSDYENNLANSDEVIKCFEESSEKNPDFVFLINNFDLANKDVPKYFKTIEIGRSHV